MFENLNPFKLWNNEVKESSPVSSGEKMEKESSIDISVPTFRFTKEEIADLSAKGMTEDEIELKRKEVINKLARAHSGGMTN